MEEENVLNGGVAQPQAAPENGAENETSHAGADGNKVPVKFNKQIKMLDIDEAAVLAQKGMKFDMISGDFDRIRKLAAKGGKSIGEYVTALEEQAAGTRLAELTQKCGGDQSLAQHIIELENGDDTPTVGGAEELFENFPEITDIESLPEEVISAARLRGSSVLDEYLRYRRRQELNAEREMQSMNAAAAASIGAQGFSAPDNPERSEFIKALWGV